MRAQQDGDLDVLCIDRLFLNDGAGTFSEMVPNVLSGPGAFGDLDGCARHAAPPHHGHLASALPVLPTICQTVRVPMRGCTLALCSLPGRNGLLDVLTPAALYANEGTGSFVMDSGSALAVDKEMTVVTLLSDLDGDGTVDVFVGNNAVTGGTGARKVLLNEDGLGTFVERQGAIPSTLTQSIEGAAVGDVDGDGSADIVICSNYGYSALLTNDGTGNFAVDTSFPTSQLSGASFGRSQCSHVEVADVDSDGDFDIFFTAYRDNTRPSLLINDGSGSLSVYQPFGSNGLNAPGRSKATAFGDVNNDAQLDLVLCDANSVGGTTSCQVYLGQSQSYAPYVYYSASASIYSSPRDVAMGDVDGDGYLDIAMAAGNVVVYLNTFGSGSPGWVQANNFNSQAEIVGGTIYAIAFGVRHRPSRTS